MDVLHLVQFCIPVLLQDFAQLTVSGDFLKIKHSSLYFSFDQFIYSLYQCTTLYQNTQNMFL